MNGSMKLPSGAVVNWNFKAKWIMSGKTFIDYRNDSLNVSSGLNNPSLKIVDLTTGSVAFTIDISHNHSRALKAGLRQAARCQFSTLHYAGAKEEDGSIITSTAGPLNMTWQIDASPGPDGLAPNSPYFQWPKQIPSSAASPGKSHTIPAADEPAAILALT